MRLRNYALVIAVALSLVASNLLAFQFEQGDVDTSIAQLNDPISRKREYAARSLSQTVSPKKISPAIMERLTKELDFHVKLALHYALASQGEKESLLFLIDSLQQSGHMGYNYLRYTIDQDFGWNAGEYREWYNKTSAEKFSEFINERWHRKPMMDEYAEFSSFYSKQFFGSIKSENNHLAFPDMRFTDADKQKLDSLPTAKAWAIFQTAINELQKKGNRQEAARQFRIVATDFSETHYADQSRELADILEKMVLEDRKFNQPNDVGSLDITDQIKSHIHNLRNVVAYQVSQPGYCYVLSQFSIPGKMSYNADSHF